MIPIRAWLRPFVLAWALVGTVAGQGFAQPVTGTVFRATVLDQTDAPLVIAQVTVRDASGSERTVAVNARGVAVSAGSSRLTSR